MRKIPQIPQKPQALKIHSIKIAKEQAVLIAGLKHNVQQAEELLHGALNAILAGHGVGNLQSLFAVGLTGTPEEPSLSYQKLPEKRKEPKY